MGDSWISLLVIFVLAVGALALFGLSSALSVI
jgi:hypothetical protein